MEPTQYAIVHTATRVIRSITIKPLVEAQAQVLAGEELVEMNPHISLTNGPWKLDGSNLKVAATLQEFRNAGYDEDYNRLQRIQDIIALKAAINLVVNDAGAGYPKVKMIAFMKALDKVLSANN